MGWKMFGYRVFNERLKNSIVQFLFPNGIFIDLNLARADISIQADRVKNSIWRRVRQKFLINRFRVSSSKFITSSKKRKSKSLVVSIQLKKFAGARSRIFSKNRAFVWKSIKKQSPWSRAPYGKLLLVKRHADPRRREWITTGETVAGGRPAFRNSYIRRRRLKCLSEAREQAKHGEARSSKRVDSKVGSILGTVLLIVPIRFFTYGLRARWRIFNVMR